MCFLWKDIHITKGEWLFRKGMQFYLYISRILILKIFFSYLLINLFNCVKRNSMQIYPLVTYVMAFHSFIGKEYFAAKEPSRAQKANGSSSFLRRIKDFKVSTLLGGLKTASYRDIWTIYFGFETSINNLGHFVLKLFRMQEK